MSGNSSSSIIQSTSQDLQTKPVMNGAGEKASSEQNISGSKHQLEAQQDDFDWDDRRGYMSVKRRKLADQFHGMVGEKVSTIFQDVTIHVNGWTEPSNDELKRMVHAHGGNYVFNLYGGTKVTHTIATNLPNSKIKALGDSIVCTPAWIVDSIAKGHQLPTDGYLLYNNHSSQKKLGFSKMRQVEREKESFELSKDDRSCLESQKDACEHSDVKASNTAVSTDNGKATEHNVHLAGARPTKAYDPSKGADFVNEFFTHSRLHYLSTWSTELKQFTAKMVNQIQPKYPKLSPGLSLRGRHQRAVVHIDLDCFFVSVSIRNKPHLKGRPVAVTHAKAHQSEDRTRQSTGSSPVKPLQDSTSDVASCSYEAREAGVKNGMSVGQAVKLCPSIELLPYDFDGYRQVSQLFYETLLHYSSTVEAVSCDEAYVELTDYAEDFDRVQSVISELRSEVETMTGCTVSAGISHNMLLARLSTRTAKPNGQFYLPLDEAESFLASLSVRDLPGVGYSTANKLNTMGVEMCGELRTLTLAKLQKDFGLKNGTMLYEFARGIDTRPLKQTAERKSVSVDINYGIRFTDISEAESLIRNLADELEKRAKEAEVVGGNVTLKMKVRKQDVPHETWKYLGHGACDNVSRSTILLQPTQEAKEIGQFAVKLLRQLKVVASDIRGVGLQLSKLVSTCESGRGGVSSSKDGANLRTMFQTASSAPSTDSMQKLVEAPPAPPPLPGVAPQSSDKTLHTYFQPKRQTGDISHWSDYSLTSAGATATTKPVAEDESFLIDLPPVSQLDPSVLEALPTAMRNQILKSYEKSIKSEDNQPLSELIDKEKDELMNLLTSAGESNVQTMATVASTSHVTDCKTRAIETSSVSAGEDEAEMSKVVQQGPSKGSRFFIDNEEEFLKEFRKYIREWISNSKDGPKECDAVTFSEFFTLFTEANLEVTQIILRFFRRLILRVESKGWTIYFNTLLAKVHEVTKRVFGGTLKIDELGA